MHHDCFMELICKIYINSCIYINYIYIYKSNSFYVSWKLQRRGSLGTGVSDRRRGRPKGQGQDRDLRASGPLGTDRPWVQFSLIRPRPPASGFTDRPLPSALNVEKRSLESTPNTRGKKAALTYSRTVRPFKPKARKISIETTLPSLSFSRCPWFVVGTDCYYISPYVFIITTS